MVAGLVEFRTLLGRMATAAERQADAMVATNSQVLLLIEKAEQTRAELADMCQCLGDVRDAYGKLLTLQTGGVPPWYFRDKGITVVDRPPEPPPIEMRYTPGAGPKP